jgi:hypothetical protein
MLQMLGSLIPHPTDSCSHCHCCCPAAAASHPRLMPAADTFFFRFCLFSADMEGQIPAAGALGTRLQRRCDHQIETIAHAHQWDELVTNKTFVRRQLKSYFLSSCQFIFVFCCFFPFPLPLMRCFREQANGNSWNPSFILVISLPQVFCVCLHVRHGSQTG